MKKIILKNLQKNNGEAVILDALSLDVNEGEIFVLAGTAESGKSLVTKIINGMAVRTAGDVCVDDRYIPGFVISEQTFHRSKTAYKALKYYAELNNRTFSHGRIVNTLNLVGLRKAMHVTINRYTPGQIARLKIAVALVAHPGVLVLDEPFQNLTPEEARAIRVILKTVADKQNTAVLLTSETITGVEEIFDTLGIIDDGVMVMQKSYNVMKNENAAFTKVCISTASPNLTARIIEQAFKYETNLCGSDVIVNTLPSNAQRMYEELCKQNIKVLGMTRVNKSMQEKFYEIIKNRTPRRPQC